MFDLRRGRSLIRAVNIPIELYESSIGRYFIGNAPNLSLSAGMAAWARLCNPTGSQVNLHVNVWTVTGVDATPFHAQFWFNANVPGVSTTAPVTPTNTALVHPPAPRVQLQMASNVIATPQGGVLAFEREGVPGQTLVDTENGKLIFPPGGSFLIYLTLRGAHSAPDEARIALGWWEDDLSRYSG